MSRVHYRAMKLPIGLTPQEIRVLQEYRRVKATALPLEELRAIKHPEGGGDAPALSLVEKGYLLRGEGDQLSLTDKATAFLAIDHVPDGT